MRIPSRSAEQHPSHNTSTVIMGGGDSSQDLYGVHADVLIPGRGDPIPHGGMVISKSEGIITWVGAHESLPSKYNDVAFTAYRGALMPGMWDVHTHLMGAGAVGTMQESMWQFLPGDQARVGAVLVDDLRAALQAGFTSVRELGGAAGHLQPLIARGVLAGPTVYSALTALSITGGHGDEHDYPLGLLRGPSNGDGAGRAVRRRRRVRAHDAPGDTQRRARRQALRDGRRPQPQRPARGRAVLARRDSRPSCRRRRAGVRSVEHGMYLDEEVAALVLERGAVLVPTRHIVESLAAGAEELPPMLAAKLARLLQLSRDSFALAVARGVRVALGTDTFSSDRASPLAHGRNAGELHWMKVAGMTPLRAIESATAIPPETLGPQAPRAGQLREGYDADFIVVKESPLDDVDVLTDPSNITHVWKGGKAYKSP